MKMHLWDDTRGHLEIPYRKYAYVKHSNGQHVSLYGDRLKKVSQYLIIQWKLLKKVDI